MTLLQREHPPVRLCAIAAELNLGGDGRALRIQQCKALQGEDQDELTDKAYPARFRRFFAAAGVPSPLFDQPFI